MLTHALRFPPVYFVVFVLAFAAFGAFVPVSAQDLFSPLQSATVEEESPADEPAPFPEAFQIAGRYRSLADSAARAETELARLSEVSVLESELEEMQQRLETLGLLVSATEAEHVRPERLSRLRDRGLQYEQRLNALYERAADRLQEANEFRIGWAQRKAYWSAWGESLAGQVDAPAAIPELQRATERIGEVERVASSTIAAIEPVQMRADRLREEAREIGEEVANVRARRLAALTQRNEPVLFSGTWLDQIVDADWSSVSALRQALRTGFFPSNRWLVVVHLLLVILLAAFVRRVRRYSIPEDAWSGLLRHPWAFGTFAATSLLADRYWLAPGLWDAMLWAVLAGAGAMLATSLLRSRAVRVVLYLLAVLYPLFLVAEVLQIPPPHFRLGLAVIAGAGVIGFGATLVRMVRAPESDVPAKILLAIGSLMWAVVLFAAVTGFYVLARWIVHATVMSAYVIFVVVFLMVAARGGVQTLLRVEAKGRLSFLRTVGVPLVERVLRLVLIVLAIMATLNVLDIWGVASTPLETWQRITSVGVTLGGVEITLDRVLLAALAVYLTILASWAVRAFTRSEVYPRWELERGVGDSMNALLHYVFVIAGLFIGLGALGFQLQNFAILAGALGIGIGFGLQNIVNNFVSGLILLFERPVRVGDTVVIDDEFGMIQKIGLRSTTVLRVDQSEVIVPNADLVSEKVVNWTLSTPVARLIIPVGVAYGTDVSRVLRILSEVADADADVMSDPTPQILFIGFGESSLDFEIRVWVQEFQRRLPVRSVILTEIARRFAEEGIEIPFPQRDLHVRTVDQGVLGRLSRNQDLDSESAPG